jgi:hypothetical protein
MPAKAPSAASAARGAAVAVTKTHLKWIGALALLIPTLILGFQNCTVELSETTYGAAPDCAPTAEELTHFEPALMGILQANGSLAGGGTACGTCHLVTSGNSASARFGVLAETDAAAKQSNFCATLIHADKFVAGFLSAGHLGGTYTDVQVQALIDWANAVGR